MIEEFLKRLVITVIFGVAMIFAATTVVIGLKACYCIWTDILWR